MPRDKAIPCARKIAKQYKNTRSCRFEPIQILDDGPRSSVIWTMHLRHKYLNLGREIRLEGVSVVEQNSEGLIVSHRDYFDVSAFVLKSFPGANLLQKIFRK